MENDLKLSQVIFLTFFVVPAFILVMLLVKQMWREEIKASQRDADEALLRMHALSQHMSQMERNHSPEPKIIQASSPEAARLVPIGARTTLMQKRISK